MEQRDFRDYIQTHIFERALKANGRQYRGNGGRSDILLKSLSMPNEQGIIQFTLHKDLIPRSYAYIDYDSRISDGGFFYTIDLFSYIQDPDES
jgi:hypothetical protein